MRFDETPVLDARSAVDVFEALRRRRPAFVPEWQAGGDAGDALQRIVARFAHVVADHLNKAPDRAFLAFLDILGISLIPARPARAPVVFTTVAGMGDAQAPAGTRVGANVPGSPSPMVFETESAIALAGARLTDVVTVVPDRDAYALHSADAAGGRAFTLFGPLQPVPHVLYLAHDTVFDVAKDAAIEVAIELGAFASAPIAIDWQYWDGKIWQMFKAFDSTRADASQDGTAGLTRSGTVSLQLSCGRPARSKVAGIDALWIRAVAADPLPPDPNRALATVDRIRARALVDYSGELGLDAAFAGPLRLDVSSTFYPFGLAAIQGAICYLASDEAFSKHGATVYASFALTNQVPDADPASVVRWQYWNGERWVTLPGVTEGPYFSVAAGSSNSFSFVVPPDISPVEVNGQKRFWLRGVLATGSYFFKRQINVTGPPNQTIDLIEQAGPAIKSVTITYRWRPAFQPVQQCCTYNDFQYELHSADVRTPGNFFAPFRPVADATPTLYVGFDAPLPNDLVSLYIDVDDTDRTLPRLVWEGWDGDTWRTLQVADETVSFAQPGIVSFIAPAVASRSSADLKSAAGAQIVTASALQAAPFHPGQQVVIAQADKRELARIVRIADATLVLEAPLAESYTMGSVSTAALPRFGVPRDWVRARLKENGAPADVHVNGMALNAVSALQTQTITGEVLGSGNGQAGQTLFFSHFPVLPGEEIEVRELEGVRAHVELPMLRDELLADGFTDADIRTVVDPRSGKVREVWVRWRSRPHLYFSSPTDRHYVVERSRGRLVFGGPNGRIPTVGTDNIRARTYRSGGGVAGNVPRGAINQLLGGALAQAVSNPRAAGGGADGETTDALKDRGPETLRHRWRALSANDYEALARESSPGIAAVRVLPATASNGRPAPGWVTVVIVPQGREARPQPSVELRAEVHAYISARMPGTVDAAQVTVIGPTYRPVGVAALVTPRVRGDAGTVSQRVKAALAAFLHPLTGGPDGRGWEFGRGVFLSDVAALLEALPGVDYVRQLDLLLDGTPVGPRVDVPPDQIVVAGDLRIEMEAGA